MSSPAENKVKTFWVKIFIAGDLNVIEKACSDYCRDNPYCVTVSPTKYIYKGGQELGAIIGLINYPKFPQPNAKILKRARVLADFIALEANQRSYSIQTPAFTEWVNLEGNDAHA